MELNTLVEATATEIISYGVRFKFRNEIILVKSVDLSWYPGPLRKNEQIQIGQKVLVKILHKLENEYIGSLKEAKPEENPWLTPPKKGEVYLGTVTSVTEYGCIFRFNKTLSGLLHIDDSTAKYEKNQKLKIKVKFVDIQRKRINLTDIINNT